MDSACLIPVSVIIPCYRCACTIERAVQSILLQTSRPTEIILIEDSSGDETFEVLLKLHHRFPKLVIVARNDMNQGASSTRNTGWRMASQPYIAFLDADDTWHPQKLEIQYNYMVNNPSVALTGHGYRRIDSSDVLPAWELPSTVTVEPYAVRVKPWKLLISNRFVTPSVMLKKDLKIYFADNQRHMEDHRLWLEILLSGYEVRKIEMDLVGIYKPIYGSSGLSSDLWSMEKAELENYLYFFKTKKISFVTFHFLRLLSCVKFLKRLIVSTFIRKKTLQTRLTNK